MLSNVTFFDQEEELSQLTGLSHDELWEAGFNLDDWDFGFVSDLPWDDGWWDSKSPYYQYWLLTHMESHCVGYHYVEYAGRHYYMVYHS